MSILLNGDCLDEMKDIDDNSIDLIFCDLPYATKTYSAVSCKWNTPIDLDKFWIEIMRIKKINTPLFFTTTTKFGVELINSAPKKCPFRYDIVWVKSAPAGFLSAKKMPMRKHEMIYVFYEKLPFYDLSSHKHKFIKEEIKYDVESDSETYGNIKRNDFKDRKNSESRYDPPLPVSVIKEDIIEPNKDCELIYGKNANWGKNNYTSKERASSVYDPPLPTTMLEVKSTRGKHSTEKPVALMEWILKYYSKEGDTILDPTMGSGSTGVACKNMKRNFIGIEMDKEIYEVAVNRIED